MRELVAYLVAFWVVLGSATAQDIRYSQYFNNPITMNPALTGVGIEHLRATISYRRQAAGPATPFTTKGVALDKSVGRFGLGFTLNSNGAGSASIKTLQLAGSLSYGIPFGHKGSNKITAGLQLGAINKSLDPSKLTFDNQFAEDIGYDPSMVSGETFETNSIIRPALSMGMHWKRSGGKKTSIKPHLAYGLLNVNQPNVSFFGDDTKYHVKHVIQGGADMLVSDELTLKPGFYQILQGPFNETGFGLVASYQNNDHHEIQGGVFGKAGKAFVVYAGYQIDRFLVGMSYDVLTGPIKDAGKGYNAFELSLTFTPKAKERTPKPSNTEKEKAAPKKKETGPKPTTNKEVRSTDKPIVNKPVSIENKIADNKTPVAKPNTATTSTKPIVQAEAVQTMTPLKAKISLPDAGLQPTKGVRFVTPATSVATTTEQPEKASNVDQNISIAPVVPKAQIAKAEERVLENTHSDNIEVDVPKEGSVKVEKTLQQAPAASVFTPIVPNNKIVAPDSDGDGVNDFEDPCPFIKGSMATRGCPDSDDDGIIDMVDFCPLESGPRSSGGCPVKESLAIGQTVVSTFDHVLFNTGSTTLTIDNTYDIIERAVELMYQDKSTFVLISGHTDSEGDAASNMMLSQQRADRVARYFVEQGIKASRIKTITYGENMPISGNYSDAARKLNRRVEITILKKAD